MNRSNANVFSLIAIVMGSVLGWYWNPFGTLDKTVAANEGLATQPKDPWESELDQMLIVLEKSSLKNDLNILSRIASMSEEELLISYRYMKSNESGKNGNEHDRLVSYLVTALADKNYELALETVIGYAKGDAIPDEWTVLVRNATLDQIDSIRNALVNLGGKHVKFLSQQLFVANPDVFFDLSHDLWSELVSPSVFLEWAKRDPDTAYTAIQRIENPENRISAMRGYYAYMLRVDSDKTIEDILKLPNAGKVLKVAIPHFAYTFINEPSVSKKEVETVLSLLNKVESEKFFYDVHESIHWHLMEKHPDVTLEWGLKLPQGIVQKKAIEHSILELAERDLFQALAYVEEIDNPILYHESMEQVISEWAEQNPSDLLEWAKDNLDGALKEYAFVDAFEQMSEYDITNAFALVQTMPPGRMRDILIDELSYEAPVQLDPKKILAWVYNDEHLSEDQRSDMYQSVYDEWVRRDPLATLSLIKDHSLEYLEDYASRIAKGWAESDAESAINWASQLSEEYKIESVASAMEVWVEYDSKAAAEWIMTLEEGQVREVSLHKYSKGLVRENPAQAIRWALKVSNPSYRTNTMDHVIANWEGANIDMANKIFHSAEVSAAEVQLYNKMINDRIGVSSETSIQGF